MSIYLLNLNDQLLQLPHLRTIKDETIFVDDATVTASLYTLDGAVVSALQDLQLDYVPASNGVYEGTVPSTFSAVPGTYMLVISAVSGGRHYYKKFKVKVVDNIDGKVPYEPYTI